MRRSGQWSRGERPATDLARRAAACDSPPAPKVPMGTTTSVAAGRFVFTHGGRVMRMVAAVVSAVLVLPTLAQETPKPGPEHEQLKKMEGNWETTMKAG